jgi:hypothetical protein
VPGARLPHAWIKFDSLAPSGLEPLDVSYVKELPREEIECRRYSTLDLCHFDKFTLIASSQEAWSSRYESLVELLKRWGIPVKMWVSGSDFFIMEKKHLELFNREARLSEGGAILIRPDQHILGCPGSGSSSRDLEHLIRSHLNL